MRFGLRARILLALGGVVAAGGAVWYVVFSGLFEVNARDSALHQATLMARAVALAAGDVDWSDDRARRQTLASLRQRAGVALVAAVRKDGRPWSDEERAALAEFVHDGRTLRELVSGRRATARFVRHGRTEYVLAAAPVGASAEGKAANVLLVAVPASPWLDRTEFMRRGVLLFGGLVLLLLFAAGSIVLTRVVIHPIERLMRRMEQLRLGEDVPARSAHPGARQRGDELVQLGLVFEDLAARVKRYQADTELAIARLTEMNERLKSAHEQLVRSEKLASVGVLTAGIAHEIGNPISIIVGYLEMLDDENLSRDERRQYVEHIRTAVQRVHRIVRDLLDFSRGAGRDDDRPPRADVRTVVEHTIKLLRPQKRFRHVGVELQIDAATPLRAAIHDNALEQILVNLLINAADAMDGQGRVSVAARLDGDAILLEVSDEGPGIPPTELRKIFDPFYTTKRPGHGTGLGLFMVHQIVETYGGQIRVDSTLGRGTTFHLRLPRAEDSRVTSGYDGLGEGLLSA